MRLPREHQRQPDHRTCIIYRSTVIEENACMYRFKGTPAYACGENRGQAVYNAYMKARKEYYDNTRGPKWLNDEKAKKEAKENH